MGSRRRPAAVEPGHEHDGRGRLIDHGALIAPLDPTGGKGLMGAHRGQPFIKQLHSDISTPEHLCECLGFHLCCPSRRSSGAIEGEWMADHYCHRLFFDN